VRRAGQDGHPPATCAHLADHNAEQPEHQCFVVEYDDSTPSSIVFATFFRPSPPSRPLLEQWALGPFRRDSIVAVTQLVDRILENKQARHPAARDEVLRGSARSSQVRDVMLLAAATTIDRRTRSSAGGGCARSCDSRRAIEVDLGVGVLVTSLRCHVCMVWRHFGVREPCRIGGRGGWRRAAGDCCGRLGRRGELPKNPRAQPQHKIALPQLLNFPLGRSSATAARCRAPTTAMNCWPNCRACSARCTSTASRAVIGSTNRISSTAKPT